MLKLVIHVDGGARGNPGPAGLGVYIQDEEGNVLLRHSRYLGDDLTNNQAEYMAVVDGLVHAQALGADEVKMYVDSELVVKQLNHEYKVKNEELAKLFVRVWNMITSFKKTKFIHVPREQNLEADKLVNEAIDRHVK